MEKEVIGINGKEDAELEMTSEKVVKNDLYDVYCASYSKAVDEVLNGETLNETLNSMKAMTEANAKLIQKFLHRVCAYIEKNSEFNKEEIRDFVAKNVIMEIC